MHWEEGPEELFVQPPELFGREAEGKSLLCLGPGPWASLPTPARQEGPPHPQPSALPTGLLAPHSTPSRYSLAKDEGGGGASPDQPPADTDLASTIPYTHTHTHTRPLLMTTIMMTNSLALSSTSSGPDMVLRASLCDILTLILLSGN